MEIRLYIHWGVTGDEKQEEEWETGEDDQYGQKHKAAKVTQDMKENRPLK